MAQHNELGKLGEDMAVDYLRSHGYEILERNYHFQKAEVDIIAKKDSIIAVVEVKTRSTLDFGNPKDFLKPKQIQRLVKAIDHYIVKNDLEEEVRFDIIAIVKEKNKQTIEHIEDAYYFF